MHLVEKVLGLADLRVESKNSLTSFLPCRKGGKEFEYGAVGVYPHILRRNCGLQSINRHIRLSRWL